MLTEKQMKALPKGEYRNADLNRINRRHCVGVKMKPEYVTYVLTSPKDENGYRNRTEVVGLKNRQQRRK